MGKMVIFHNFFLLLFTGATERTMGPFRRKIQIYFGKYQLFYYVVASVDCNQFNILFDFDFFLRHQIINWT